MKILFIAQAFAPDSAIGAVRISKLSKYLHSFGHEVTILCSSKCVGKRDENLLDELQGISIHRYDALCVGGEKRSSRLVSRIRYYSKRILIKLYTNIVYPIKYVKETRNVKKEILDYYALHFKDERFDILFATFSPRATIEAGMDISARYGMPLLVDLRDLMNHSGYPLIIQLWNKPLQEKAIRTSRCTLVISNGQKKILERQYNTLSDKIEVLSNGFDAGHSSDSIKGHNESGNDNLVFVYTGTLYEGQRNLTPLYRVIKDIRESSCFNFRFIYAGTSSQLVHLQMSKYGIQDILDNRGKLTRSESEVVQNEADIFLVASWNTEKEQGIMTGKFYDGIRSGKPIVALVSGDVPESDLYLLNEEYHYGYCYESCKGDSFDGLKNYIIKLCEEKRKHGLLRFAQSEELRARFSYNNIAKELESKMIEIVREKHRDENCNSRRSTPTIY